MSNVGTSPLVTRTFLAEGGAIGSGLVVVAGTANNQVKLPGAAEDPLVIGITTSAAAAAGDPIQVAILGIVDHVVDGTGTAITVGLFLASKGTNGYGMAWTKANAKHPHAKALEASTAAGDTIAVLLCHFAPPAS